MICCTRNHIASCHSLGRMVLSVFALAAAFPTHAESVRKPTRLLVQPAAITLRGPQAEHGILVSAVLNDGRDGARALHQPTPRHRHRVDQRTLPGSGGWPDRNLGRASRSEGARFGH